MGKHKDLSEFDKAQSGVAHSTTECDAFVIVLLGNPGSWHLCGCYCNIYSTTYLSVVLAQGYPFTQIVLHRKTCSGKVCETR